jgi:Aspartyl protease
VVNSYRAKNRSNENGCRFTLRFYPKTGEMAYRFAEAHATLFKTITILAVAVLAATGSASSATASSQDAQALALLAKHRAYVGWQFGDGTFKSMRITGDVTNDQGEKTERFVLLSKGLVYHDVYTELKLGDITSHAGFTGNLFWRSDFNGFTTPIYGDRAKFLASFTLLQQEGTTELPASFVENKTVDGKSVSVVRVTLKNGDAIDLAVDPQTGAYVQATIDPGGAAETTYHILSYRDVFPGKKMMAAYRIDDGKSIHNYDDFEPNAAVTDAELHPPAPTAEWTFGSQDAFPITLTPTRILIDATVNGVKGRFILDTGATAIVLDEAFAERAKIETLKGKSEAATMYGMVPTRARRAATIAFGGSVLHNVLVFSEDFRNHDYRGLDRQGYDGLVGYDLFAGAIVKLDVYGSKMALLDPASDLTGARGLPLLVDLSEGVPAIPMTLNGSIAVNAFLDTGNPGVVFYGPELVRKRHLKIFAGCGNIESLTIGPITYAAQEACEWGFAANNMLLGYDFLKHFNYVFDYPHGVIYMAPNKN